MDGSSSSTAARYRLLYHRGYAAAKEAQRPQGAPGLRIYVGELSELTHVGRLVDSDPETTEPVRSTCGARRLAPAPRTTDYLAAVVRARPEPLLTSGVAWHPYQHRSAPNVKTYPRVESPEPTTGRLIGIGYTREMNGRIEALSRERIDVEGTSRPRLSTADREVPGLYMTEFGYFSAPFPDPGDDLDRDPPPLRRWLAWHSEQTRSEWLPLAYDFAKQNDVRLMLQWQLDEPELPETTFTFDTGLLSNPADMAEVDNNDDLRLTLRAHGTRSYGKEHGLSNRERNWTKGRFTDQQRRAYCALRGWAAANDYAPLTITPGQDLTEPANLAPVVCQ